MKRKILLCALAVMILASCTRNVYVPVQRPATVFVGQHIQRVAIINRSTPENKDAALAAGVLTGSLPSLNKEAAQQAIEGLFRSLQSNNRYDVVRTSEEYTTPSLWGNWPPHLSWEEVDRLCKKYNVDAVILLEAFDSNFIVTNGARDLKKKDSDGKEFISKEFYVEGVATVNLGFRMYDPQREEITDEYMFNHIKRWEKTGTALQLIIGSIIENKLAVNETAYNSGSVYSNRISPRWLRVTREFYTKGRGNSDFKIGVRRATVNDWAGAMEAWHRSANSRKSKTAGRSAFNLALMYEIMGDLETARQWAQKAYVDYGIKKGRSYANILQRRIRDAQLLD